VARGKTRVASPFQFELPRIGGVAATDLRLVKSFLKLSPADSPLDFFICGGAQVYEQALPLCSDLYLTLVKRVVEGDAFFPPFEHQFEAVEEIADSPDFKDYPLPASIVEKSKAGVPPLVESRTSG